MALDGSCVSRLSSNGWVARTLFRVGRQFCLPVLRRVFASKGSFLWGVELGTDGKESSVRLGRKNLKKKNRGKPVSYMIHTHYAKRIRDTSEPSRVFNVSFLPICLFFLGALN